MPMHDHIPSYTGGKAGSGVYQKIINLMPPHRVYIEPFLGGGAIMRMKRPAVESIGVEINHEVIRERWSRRHTSRRRDLTVIQHDAMDFLKTYDFPRYRPADFLIYCDPPYLQSVRSSKRAMYDFEFMTEPEHIALLNVLRRLECNVMISGYPSSLYDKMLSNWRRVEFTGVSRGGPRTEVVWLNFPEPAELHDYRFLGDDYRKRLDFKRMRERQIKRLRNMEPQKRYALLSAIETIRSDRSGNNADAAGDSGIITDARSSSGENAATLDAAEIPLSAHSGINASVEKFLKQISHLENRFGKPKPDDSHLIRLDQLQAVREFIGRHVECDCHYCRTNPRRRAAAKMPKLSRAGSGRKTDTAEKCTASLKEENPPV